MKKKDIITPPAKSPSTRGRAPENAAEKKSKKARQQTPGSDRNTASAGSEYYTLFEQSPMSLWEEDLSAVKKEIDHLRGSGVRNFEKFFTNNPGKVAEYSRLIKIINVNKSTLDLYGARSKSSFITALDSIFTDVSAHAFREGIIKLAQGKTSFEAVTRNRNIKGQPIDIILHLNILKGYENDWSRVMVSVIDITDWKKKSEALLQSEEKLKATLEATEDGIIVVDPDRKIITMNKQFIRMWSIPAKYTDLSRNPTLYNTLLKRVSDSGKFAERRKEIYSGTGIDRDIIRLKDGRYFEVHTRPLTLHGKFGGRTWSFRDVTERYTAEKKIRKLNRDLEKEVDKRTRELSSALVKISRREEELHQSEELFRETFETAPHGMGIYDSQGRFIMTNRAYSSIVGYRPRELRGKHFTDITHPDDAEKSGDFFGKLIKGEIPSYQIEKRYIHKDGYPVWVLLSVSMIRDSQGKPLRILGQIIDITKNKKTEWLLRDSEEMYRRLFDEAIDAIFVADIKTGITTDCNRAATRLLGREKAEIIGAPHSLVHPPKELVNGMSRSYLKHSKAGQDELLETQVIRKDGAIRDVAIKASRFEYKGKTYMQGIFRDITEQKAAEDNVKMFFSITLDMLAIAGFDGFFRQVSPSWQQTLGWSSGELTSRPFMEFVHPEDIEPTIRAVENLGRGKTVINFENRYRCKDGSYRWISWNSFAVTEKQLIYAAARDMTLRRNEEERLKQSEENLRLVIEDLPLAVAISTGEKIEYANAMFTDLFGYTLEDVRKIGEWFVRAYPDPEYRDEVVSAWNTLVDSAKKTGEKVLPIEVKVRCKDGSDKQIEIRATVIGERIIVNFYDLTKRKEEEMALVRARDDAESANRAKSEFLANMSHEIRTPLNAVIGFSELLSEMATDPKQKSYTKSIKTAGKSLLTLINDILDLSKIEAGMMKIQLRVVEPLSLFSELKDFFETVIQNKGLDFIVDLDPALPRGLLLDEIRLRQVLVNLLGNAIKFTDRGHIKLAARCLPKKEDTSKIDLLVLVEDTGIGIPKDNLGIIFNSFMQPTGQNTVKYGGTGLGLSISKKLVEMMNGSISVMSAPGKGSTFIVTINSVNIAAIDRPSPGEPEREIINLHFHNARALVVDDVASNRVLVMELLKKWGMRVLEAVNGEEAVLLAEQYRPDIIIMDLRMPVMDGYTAIKEIRKNDAMKSIPIIALTASAEKSNMEHVLESGFTSYLIKPIDSETLMNEIARCIPHSLTEKPLRKNYEPAVDLEALSVLDAGLARSLLPELDRSIIPDLEQVSGTIVISDIKKISEKIRIAGEKYGAGFMTGWSNLLTEYAATVDIEGVRLVIEMIKNARAIIAKKGGHSEK